MKRGMGTIALLACSLSAVLLTGGGCPAPKSFSCQTDRDCADGRPCTDKRREGGSCVWTNKPALQRCGVAASNAVCNDEGRCVGCSTASDCGDSTRCRSYACKSNECILTVSNPVLNDTVPGDCKRPACDADGNEVEEPDMTDAPAPDSSSCTEMVCGPKGLQQVPSDPIKECGTGGHCDGMGSCVTCSDGVQNGDEAGIDCGGLWCKRCLGSQCDNPAECQSGVCDSGVCRLGVGAPCGGDTYCATSLCSSGVCQACALNKQCATGHCEAGQCKPCTDDLQCDSHVCLIAQGFTAGVCALPSGAPCSSTVPCAPGLTCKGFPLTCLP